jgi:hypothetical protein
MGAAGPAGPPGPSGAQGAKGDKGDTGDSGLSLRLVRPGAPAGSCNADEVMVSAVCTGKFTRNPLTTTEKGANCGPDIKSNTNEVTILCAKM